MAVAHLIPADLATDMAELAEHIAAGSFETILTGLAAPTPCPPGSIRDRIGNAVRAGRCGRSFAESADAVAASLDRLDPAARAVAVFMLLPSAGDSGARRSTESDFAFVVRLLGSQALVWEVAGLASDPPRLPGWCEAALAVEADPLPAAWRYLSTVPDAAGWLAHRFTGGPHPVDDGRFFVKAAGRSFAVLDAASGKRILAGDRAECERWASRLSHYPSAAMPVQAWLTVRSRWRAAARLRALARAPGAELRRRRSEVAGEPPHRAGGTAWT